MVGPVSAMLSRRVLLVIAVGLAVGTSAHSESQHESVGLQGRETSKRIDSENSFDVRSVPRQQNKDFESINDWLETQETENMNFRSQREGALNDNDIFNEEWELEYPDEKTVDTSNVFGMSTNAKEQGVVSDCVKAIANTGFNRAFPTCRDYVSDVVKFCKSHRGRTTHARVCRKVFASIRLAKLECNVETQQGNPMSEICKTLLPKRNKASCNPGQLSGQIPGSSSTSVCFDAPLSTQSNTYQLPLNLYNPHNREENTVEIHTLPIGQGDCTVIYCPNEKCAILFDCGAKGGNMLSPPKIRNFFSNVDSIYILISHGHADHYNYIPAVFDVNESPDLVGKIKEVVLGGPRDDYSCKKIREWLNMIFENNKSVTFLTDSSKVHQLSLCTGIEFHVAVGNSEVKRAKNERGMVMKLNCPSCKGSDDTPPRSASLLFAGDMEGLITAKALAESFPDLLDSTHYKMAHHGASSLANQEDWLKAIKPIEVHISHKYNGRYGHPRCEAIDRLMQLSPRTVGTTGGAIGGRGHIFNCVKVNGKYHQPHDQEIFHRLYSTAPRVDKICIIKLSFTLHGQATTHYYCGDTPNEIDLKLDDCEEEEED